MSTKIEQWISIADKYASLCAEDDEKYTLDWDELHQLSQSLALACDLIENMSILGSSYSNLASDKVLECEELKTKLAATGFECSWSWATCG